MDPGIVSLGSSALGSVGGNPMVVIHGWNCRRLGGDLQRMGTSDILGAPTRSNRRIRGACCAAALAFCSLAVVASSNDSHAAGSDAASPPGTGDAPAAGAPTELTAAIATYCADRTDGPGPDIPQLKAAGLLAADWEGGVDVDLNPPTGGTQCGSGGGTYAIWTPSPTSYPVDVTGCNGTVSTFAKAPEKALSVDQISYQMALALGLKDRIYGFWPTRTDDLDGGLRALKVENQQARPVEFGVDSDASKFKAAGMGDNVDHSEQIRAFAPDLLFTGDWFGWPMAFGWDGPTPMEANAAEIAPTYMGFTNNGWYCAATGDGAYDEAQGWVVGSADAKPQRTFEYLYDDLRNLGTIFDVQDKAFAVISQLKGRVTAALAKADGKGERLKATTFLVGYGDTVPASWDADKAMYYSQRDPINAAMTQLGMTNVWGDDPGAANMTTAESFIAKMPDVIILQSVYPDCHDARDFIMNDPAWKQARVPAVVNDRLVCVQTKDGYLGLGLPIVLSAVADKLAE